MNKIFSASVKLGLLACSFFSGINVRAIAQVTSDGTLDTQVNQNGNSAVITGGETRGGNLFHSFQDFSVGTGNEASFNNADSISNIFSRVTGGNISNIDGVIRANGSASLFLINPAGIIFGESARLDIGGSFYGSSASSILFEDGEFSAVDNLEQPILTINAPIGLRFRDNPGDITIRGDGNGTRLADSEPVDTQDALRVNGNATIGFIGGNLNFESATVKTAGGRIELGSVAGGRVDIVEVANGFSFDYSAIETFKDISLSGTSSVIDASGNGGGDINIAGRNIFINDSSGIEANTLGDETGGEINVFATDEISISGVENENNFISAITSRTFANATANGGDINIETGSLSIGDRAGIFTDTNGQGNAGDISINANGSVSLESQGNSTQIASFVAADAVGNGGNININTNSLTLDNGALFSASNFGQGNAGDININSTESISLTGQENGSVITATVLADVIGDAGNIDLTTGSLTLDNGSVLRANNLGEGNAGNVSIESIGNVEIFNDSNIEVAATVGDSGNISINSEFLTLNNDSLLITDNSDTGNAGNVTINLTEDFNITNNSFVTVAGRNGNAGNIELNLNSLTVDNSPISLFAANLVGSAGGNIIINAVNNIAFSNTSRINVSGFPGGSINITAKNLSLQSGTEFFAGIGLDDNSESSNLQSGDIAISLSEDLVIDGAGEQENLTSLSNSNFSSRGNSGDTIIDARNIRLLNGGQISSNSNSEGNVGNITLNAAENITVSNSDGNSTSTISTFINTEGSGDVGEINLSAQNLNIADGTTISSIVSGRGNSGDINLNIADTITIDGSRESTLNNIMTTIGSSISSEVSPGGVGDSGDINIDTQNLILSEEGNIRANTLGQGNGGDIHINANSIIMTELSTIVSASLRNFFTGTSPEANAGNITINTTSLSINSGSDIVADTSANGNAGNITINATDKILVNGTGTFLFPELDDSGNIIPGTQEEVEVSSNISSDVVFEAGKGGNVEINTRQLSVTNGGQISTSTVAEGNAGNLIINANESIDLGSPETQTESRSGLFAVAFRSNGDGGNGGDIQIFTEELTLSDNATINVSNIPSDTSTAEPGSGEAGNLTIEASSLSLENNANIDAATQAGNGGNITLDIADNISLRDTGLISARALKDANGGNINIDTNFIVAFPNGNNDIIANAERGNGGNININAEALFGIQQRPLNNFSNDINASSQFSLDGTVTISTPDLNSIQGEVNLPTDIIKTEENTAQACRNNREAAAKNGLNITGKGGVVPDPALPLSSLNVTANDGTNPRSAIPAPIETSKGKIQLARGIEVTESGIIRLTAHRTNNAGDRLTETRNCG